MHAGAEQAAKELGAEVIWQAPQKEDDRQMQIQTVQNFVSRGVDAIALAPLDDRALTPSVQAAKRRNIPVIIFDSRLQGNDFTAYVATDNFKGGQLCAQRLAEVMGDQGKVVVLKYSEGSAATLEREAGFMEEIKKHSQIRIISDNQYAGATMEKAFQVSQNLMNRFGAEAQGIFASNESATQGMLRALQLAGKAGKVKFVGFDVNKTLYEAVKSGQIQGVAVQDPVKMGYESVKTAIAVINKQPYEKTVDTGVKMITSENLQDAEVQRLLKPHLQ